MGVDESSTRLPPEQDQEGWIMEIAGLKPTYGTILQFTPDTRWKEGKLELRQKGQPKQEFTLPFLGWAVELSYVSKEDEEYETDIVPVFLEEDAYPKTTRDMSLSLGEDGFVFCVGLVP